jgi:tetratricopeptide (TPR) repeat protein
MRPTPLRAAAALAALVALAPEVLPQAAVPQTAQFAAQTPRDSARALGSARSAQAAFERLRFRHLPWTHDGVGPDRCDERIGRFCLWRGDDEGPEWVPPPEPDAVRDGRDELIARLGEAAALVPGDPWVAGQRVRYLVEADRADEAAEAARECRAGWWCRALEGFALHAAGRYADSEAAFDVALEGMPPREREAWTELAPLLSDGDWRAFRRLREEDPAAERRFWWLADPLWALPGNELRTEHFARNVMDQLQDRAAATEGISWGSDLREILLRFGWPVGWEKIRPNHPMLRQGRASVVTHYAPKSWALLPRTRFLPDPAAIEPGSWPLDDRDARAEYTPGYAAAFDELDHQLALFRRGDSALVVAAYALDPDSLPAGATTEAALVLASDEDSEPRVARDAGTSARGVLILAAEPGPRVVSLETHTLQGRRVARARYGLSVPARGGGVAVSDVLLLQDPDPLPAGLDEAVAQARGSTRVRAGESLGLFWEVYGLAEQPDTVGISVSLHRGSKGWGRRLAERLGLVGEETPIRVQWDEETPGEPTLARTLVLAIPEVAPGEYTLELSVAPREGEPAVTRRLLRVER